MSKGANSAGRRKTLKSNLSLWLPVGVWTGVIFWLSSQPHLPNVPIIGAIYWGDKIEHAIAYGIGGWLVWRALGGRMFGWRRVIVAIVIAAAYGLTDEIHQHFVPPRDFDVFDLTADIFGSAIAAFALALGAKPRRNEKRGM